MTLMTRRTFGKTVAATLGAALIAKSALAAGHATKHAVAIKGFKFSPASLAIKVGDTVVFTNEDGAPHAATADNGAFDTGRMGKGESQSIVFTEAGNIEYFCSVHPNMKASITVESEAS